MSVRRLARWTLVASGLLAPTAGAQLMPRVFCPPGQSSCFAAAFSYANYATGLPGYSFLNDVPLTVMSVYVQNLQGTYARSAASPFGLNTFGFYRQNGGLEHMDNTLFAELLPPRRHPRRSGATVGKARVGTQPFLVEDENIDPENYLSKSYSDYVSPGVMGCNLGKYRNPAFGWGWQTCPSSGVDGWVKFDFALWWAEQSGVGKHFVGIDDFFLTMGASNTPFDYACGFGRKIGVRLRVEDCPSYDYEFGPSPTVASVGVDQSISTPEPATLVLLGTGLAALGLRARRRRPA